MSKRELTKPRNLTALEISSSKERKKRKEKRKGQKGRKGQKERRKERKERKKEEKKERRKERRERKKGRRKEREERRKEKKERKKGKKEGKKEQEKDIAPYIDISSLTSMLHCWPTAIYSAVYCVLFNFITNLRSTDALKLQISSTEQPNWSNENFPLQQIKL